MIQKGTVLKCADNSGAKNLNVIGVLGYSKKRFGKIGDLMTCSVRGTTGVSTNVKDHQVVQAVLVRSKKEVRRKDGSYIRFDDNAAVIVDKNKAPKGTRIFGPVSRGLKDYGYNKIVSLAKEAW